MSKCKNIDICCKKNITLFYNFYNNNVFALTEIIIFYEHTLIFNEHIMYVFNKNLL